MTVYVIALAALAGLIAVLTKVASKTKNTIDDKVLEVAEEIEPIVESLADKSDSK